MYEVELKARADHDAVRERLSDLGADPLGRVRQADTYYDHPSRSFADTDEALRIRRESSDGERTTTLTYKGPKVDAESKTREEIETGIEDGEAMDAALRAVGFAPVATVAKKRERHALEGYTVTLDRVDDLGEFVEVEAAGNEDEIEPLREGAADLLERLGADPDATVRASYLELLLALDDR